mmetsp:Transcript_40971/g.70073  ORF Transcript_40971/g.70073 Transcript_40971/m.70073 type:complete len:246 (-) Transcript_40971:167-904(-)
MPLGRLARASGVDSEAASIKSRGPSSNATIRRSRDIPCLNSEFRRPPVVKEDRPKEEDRAVRRTPRDIRNSHRVLADAADLLRRGDSTRPDIHRSREEEEVLLLNNAGVLRRGTCLDRGITTLIRTWVVDRAGGNSHRRCKVNGDRRDRWDQAGGRQCSRDSKCSRVRRGRDHLQDSSSSGRDSRHSRDRDRVPMDNTLQTFRDSILLDKEDLLRNSSNRGSKARQIIRDGINKRRRESVCQKFG